MWEEKYQRTLEEQYRSIIDTDKILNKTTQYITEEDLEDYVVENLQLIEEGLVYQSRQVVVSGGIIDILAKDIAKVVGVDSSKLTHIKPRGTHVKNAGSHGANRPGLKVPKDLDSLKRFGRSAVPIYTLLAKNYLAMLCEDYQYERQSGHIKDYPAFKGGTNVPKSLGWKEIYESDDEEEGTTPGLGKLGKPFIHEGYPPAPPTPTMSWLMK